MSLTEFKPAALITLVITVLAALGRSATGASPLTSAFTYQGNLALAGNPVNGTADLQVTLWDALSGGIQVAGPLALNTVAVADGGFSVQMDFGAIVFNGDARWLQIAVRSPAGGGTFTTLSPRQPLTAVPYALQTRGLFVDASNKVGVGTTAPSAPLHVVGNWNTEDGALRVSGDKATLRLTSGATGGNQSWMFHVGSDGPGNLGVYNRIAPTAWLGLMGLTPSGNLGIGTTTPSARLHIANGDFIAGAPGQEWFFHTRSSFGGDFLHITDNQAGVPQFQRGLIIDQTGFIASRAEHRFLNPAGAMVAAINPDPPPGTPTFPGGTPTMSAGTISLFNPAGQERFGVWSRYSAASNTWFPNQAELFMNDANGNRVITIMSTTETGAQGEIRCTDLLVTDTKSFLVPNPDNPEQDIAFACLEGPECGMYVRGTAQLSAGRARVSLPDSFASLASHEGLTVILTPLSGDSQGLACVNRSNQGFDVVELMRGSGTYEFDWEVKAIRRGTRDYTVVRPWTEHAAGHGTQSELWQRRMTDIERRNAKIAEEDAELGPRPGAGVHSVMAPR